MTSNKIRIKRFYWENIRNFELLEVPRKQDGYLDDRAKTSLLLIQNGYGKTTTLYLLRALFTQTPIPKNLIKDGYRYRNKWGGDKNEISKFYVELDINDEFWRLGIEIDPVSLTQKFTTFSASLGGEVDGWQPPSMFRRLFRQKKEFTNLFLMDGETAREMNRDVGAKIVHESIRQVTNLSNVYLLVSTTQRKGQIDNYVDEVLSEFLGDGGGKNESLLSALNFTKEQIDKRSSQLKKVEEDIDKYESDLQDISTKIEELDEGLESQERMLSAAKEKLRICNDNLKLRTEEILKLLHNPSFSYPNWDKIQSFHISQNKAKLPRSVGKKWFDEILELDSCICGIEWDKSGDMRKHIETTKEKFLDSNLMTYVIEMQNKVSDSNSDITIGEKIKLLEEAQTAQFEAKQDVDDIRGLASEEDRKKYEKYGIEKGLLMGQLEDARDVKEDLGTESRDTINKKSLDKDMYNADKKTITVSQTKIKLVKNIACLKDIENNIVSQLGTGSFAVKMKKGADLVQDIVKTMLQDIEKEIRIELEAKMNNSLDKMVGAGTGGGLTVKISDNGLDYYNPNGDLQNNVNMAAELGGAYAFVSALNNYAEVSIPLVLDTPFAGFGKGMAANWTRLVPETFDQVIAYINSLEMSGLQSWFDNNEDVQTYLIRREGENILTGIPQEGRMILDLDYNNFINYEKDAGDLK